MLNWKLFEQNGEENSFNFSENKILINMSKNTSATIRENNKFFFMYEIHEWINGNTLFKFFIKLKTKFFIIIKLNIFYLLFENKKNSKNI